MNREEFVDLVEQYLTSSGMTPTEFGAKAAKDPAFVFDLRGGRNCGFRIVERVTDYIQGHAEANHCVKSVKKEVKASKHLSAVR